MAETFQTYTYTFLFATAKWIKEQPIPLEFPGYVLYKRISLITFLALTVESYLNHCGVLRFPWWQSAERTLSTHAKLDIILHDSGIALDPGKRPLETIKALLAFRNDIAHGKTQSHDTDHVGFVFGKPAFSRSSWGKNSNGSMMKWRLRTCRTLLCKYGKRISWMLHILIHLVLWEKSFNTIKLMPYF